MNTPFDITLWQQGQPVITRGGGVPLIIGFNKNSVYGSVGGKEIEWTSDGLNVDRQGYGYDLFMK
jgi:hypothetical protein